MSENRFTLARTWGTACAVLGCLSLLAPMASAQHDHHMERDHHKTVIVTRPAHVMHRRRVVRNVRVRRNGHWVTVKRVTYR